MPTFDRTNRFNRDLEALSDNDRELFKVAAHKFVEDLKARRAPRQSLGVRQMSSAPGVYEFHFEGDGRATFEYGAEKIPGERHVIWRRIGSHAVYNDP